MKRLIIPVLPITILLFLLAAFIPKPALALAGTLTSMSPATGPVGTVVSLSGTGFTAGDTDTVAWDGVPLTNTVIAGGGILAATFTVPATTAGVHNVSIIPPTVDTSTNVLPFTVTPLITLASTTVQVGQSIAINGQGFGANLSIIVFVDGVINISTSATGTGSFNASFAVPAGAGGTHTVTATDSAGNTTNTTYNIAAAVYVSPNIVSVGSQFTITGSSFAASSTITIAIDGVNFTTATTNTIGSFTISIASPAKPIGVHTIRAVDSLLSSATVTYSVIPSMTITPSPFTSGTQVTINGSGFAASSAVAIYIDGSVIQSNIANTSATGSFSSNLVIPNLPGGNHTLQVRDASSNTATATFSVAQGVTTSSQTGAAGANVQVSGVGFGASKVVTITFDGIKVTTAPAEIVTNASGGFSATYTVPSSSGGSHTLVITDGTISATSSFNVTASANISAVSGIVGTSVTVTGTSFGSNAAVLVTYDGQSVVTATANSNGAFSATFTVPASATGAHTVEASDGTRKNNFSFTVSAKASINPTSGNIGTPITAMGDGFKSNGTIVIKYDDIQIGGVTANVTGGWAAVFRAPASKGGSHTIIITDGTSTITAAFAMDSTAPPAPTLIAPANSTQAETLTVFQWGEVTDPSGFTYELEVSTTPTFGVFVLEKRGLTATGYQVMEQEKLETVRQEQPYYWRVRAIDGASNVGAWSQTQTFYVGTVFPEWGLYAIIGGSVALAFVLGYLLGKRRRWY